MRLYVKLTRSTRLIPFNYQPFLTGALHKWIGSGNDEHDSLSLYSFSWFQNIETNQKGINLTGDSYFFFSAYNDTLVKLILKGILNDPSVCFGASVSDVEIVDEKEFSGEERFMTASPVFIKRRLGSEEKHITYDDNRSSEFLTETLKKKLAAINLSTEGVQVKFDTSFSTPRTKIIWYKGVGNRVSICPVIISGTPEQLAFAWNVGVGNSTGIGFGALK